MARETLDDLERRLIGRESEEGAISLNLDELHSMLSMFENEQKKKRALLYDMGSLVVEQDEMPTDDSTVHHGMATDIHTLVSILTQCCSA